MAATEGDAAVVREVATAADAAGRVRALRVLRDRVIGATSLKDAFRALSSLSESLALPCVRAHTYARS